MILKTPALTDRTGHLAVSKENEMIAHSAHPFAGFASAAGPVERKGCGVDPGKIDSGRSRASGSVFGGNLPIFRKQFPYRGVQICVGGHVGTLHAVGGSLPDGNNAGKRFKALHDIFFAAPMTVFGQNGENQCGFS